jgi:hypothetical protein
MATDTERASWREACDMAGPARMRLRLEHRRNEFSPEHACEIELWLLEKEKEPWDKDKKAGPTETRRFNTIRDWGLLLRGRVLSRTIGSAIVVWPVLIKGSWCAIDAQVGGMGRSIDSLERRWWHCPRRSPHSIFFLSAYAPPWKTFSCLQSGLRKNCAIGGGWFACRGTGRQLHPGLRTGPAYPLHLGEEQPTNPFPEYWNSV